eukprot:1184016-Prorocentrum_minimum.AAC.2
MATFAASQRAQWWAKSTSQGTPPALASAASVSAHSASKAAASASTAACIETTNNDKHINKGCWACIRGGTLRSSCTSPTCFRGLSPGLATRGEPYLLGAAPGDAGELNSSVEKGVSKGFATAPSPTCSN